MLKTPATSYDFCYKHCNLQKRPSENLREGENTAAILDSEAMVEPPESE